MKKNILYFFSALMLTALFSLRAYAGCAPGETYLLVLINADDYFSGDGTVITVTVNGAVVYTGTPADGVQTAVVDGCFPEGATVSVDYTDVFGDGIVVNPPAFIQLGCTQETVLVANGGNINEATAAAGNIFAGTLPIEMNDLASGSTGAGTAIATTNPAANGTGCASASMNAGVAISPTISNNTTPPAFPSGVTPYAVCDIAGGANTGMTLSGVNTSGLSEDIEVCATYTQPSVSGNETGAYFGVAAAPTEYLDSNGDNNGDGNGANDCGIGITNLIVYDAACAVVATNPTSAGVTGLTPGATYTVCATAFATTMYEGADGVFGTGDDVPDAADGSCALSAIGLGVQPFEPPVVACDIGADIGNDVAYCFGDTPADLTTDAGSDFTGFESGPNAINPGVAYVEICGEYDAAADAVAGDPTSNSNFTGFLVGTAYTYAPGAADGGDGEGTGCDYITLVPVTYIDVAATGEFILDTDVANICVGTPIRLDFRPEITTTPSAYSCVTGITVVVDGGSPDDGTIAINNDGTATVPGDYIIAGDVAGTTSADQIVFTDLADGTYNYTVTDPAGCTTTGTFDVLVVPVDEAESASLCPGDVYTASTGTEYTASGSEAITDVNGCDAILTVTITALVPVDEAESASLCPGDVYTASTGTEYTASGSETITDANSCDATLTVTITPLVPADVSEMATLCAQNGDTFTSPTTGTVYTASGTETFTDAAGCTATLTVTIMDETPACGDPTATNYDMNATCIDNTLCTFGEYCDNICFAEFASNPGPNDVANATLCVTPLGCADLATIDPSCITTQACDDGDPCTADEEATLIIADNSVCADCGLNTTPVTPACGDPTATNYDMNATCIDNTLCTFGEYCDNICFAEYVANPGASDVANATLCVTPLGCADLATIDPSCITTQACDDGDPCTADEEATLIIADNSVCADCGLNATTVTAACGDPTAINYDMNATCIDNTLCVFTCEDAIAGSITLADCDFTGAMVNIFDASGALVGTAAADAMGNYALAGPFDCGTYTAEITAAPACYVDGGGDIGPRTFVVDGDGTPDGFNFMGTVANIPTVGEWGLIILGLLMTITAVVGIRQRRREENEVWS